MSQRMLAKHGLLKGFHEAFVGIVAVHPDFFTDYLLFLGKFLVGPTGIPPHIRDQIDGRTAVGRRTGSMQDQTFFGGEGVDVPAFVFEFGEHLQGTPVFGSLKK
jgi:hypothetical protein